MKSAKWGTGEGAAARPAPTIACKVARKGEDNLRGGGGNADSHTHSSWVLLRDGEEEGVTLPAAGNKTVCCPLRLQPSQFRGPNNEPEGPTGKLILSMRWKKKKQNKIKKPTTTQQLFSL